MDDSNQKMKINLSEFPYINEAILAELDNLFSVAPPDQLRKSLQKVFFNYLVQNAGFPQEFPQIAEDFYFLIEFLEKAEVKVK